MTQAFAKSSVFMKVYRTDRVSFRGCRDSWYRSFPKVRAMDRVWCLGRCVGLIGFWLELGSGCDVRVTARLCHRLRFGGLILK